MPRCISCRSLDLLDVILATQWTAVITLDRKGGEPFPQRRCSLLSKWLFYDCIKLFASVQASGLYWSVKPMLPNTTGLLGWKGVETFTTSVWLQLPRGRRSQKVVQVALLGLCNSMVYIAALTFRTRYTSGMNCGSSECMLTWLIKRFEAWPTTSTMLFQVSISVLSWFFQLMISAWLVLCSQWSSSFSLSYPKGVLRWSRPRLPKGPLCTKCRFVRRTSLESERATRIPSGEQNH